MFLWTGRQAVFFLVMIVICVMALIYPAWHRWYEMIFPPVCIFMLIVALGHVMRR